MYLPYGGDSCDGGDDDGMVTVCGGEGDGSGGDGSDGVGIDVGVGGSCDSDSDVSSGSGGCGGDNGSSDNGQTHYSFI